MSLALRMYFWDEWPAGAGGGGEPAGRLITVDRIDLLRTITVLLLLFLS